MCAKLTERLLVNVAWCAVSCVAFALPAQAQERADTLRLTGLREPVEVLRDAWGIAHIYARNEHDLFFTQGYTAARDRAFQFEVWRRHLRC